MTTETIALPEDYGWSLAETSRWRSLLRVAKKNPLGVVGFTLVLGFVLLGALGPFFAPHSPTAPNIGMGAQLAGPSLEHPFGTDSLGRDMLSRVMSGARLSLLLGLAAVGLGVGIGAILGVISGYFGGIIDSVIQRTGEMGAAFPTLVLYLMLIAVLGQSLRTLIIAIAIFSFIGGSRVLRALTIVVKTSTFVEASRAMGAGEIRILIRHVFPNVVPIIIVIATGAWGGAVLAEAALSFLGIGVEPGTPSWGIDLSGENLRLAANGRWHLIVFPGAALSIVVLGFNLLGDTLRDVLDPRLRGSI